MYSFEGDFRRKPQQSLGGASRSVIVARDELLQRAQSKRREREDNRKQILSATKIQAFFLGIMTRKKEKILQRREFDSLAEQCNKDPAVSQDPVILGLLMQKLAFFYAHEEDQQRLAWLSQIFLKQSSTVVKMMMTDTGQWLHRIQRLLQLNMEHLSRTVSTNSSIAVPLRLLEVFTSPQSYTSFKNEQVENFLQKIWNYLIKKGFYKQLCVILESRVPDSLETSASPPTPLAASILEFLIQPLTVGSSNYRTDIIQWLILELFGGPFSPQVYHFILPALAQRLDVLPAALLLKSLLSRAGGTEYSLTVPPSPWILYAVLYFISPQTATLNGMLMIQYLHVLKHLMKTLPDALEQVSYEAMDSDDEESKCVEMQDSQKQELNQIAEEVIDILNEPHHVNNLVAMAEMSDASNDCLMSISGICHTLLSCHRLAVHKYKLLYTLAFTPAFLRRLWHSITSVSTPSVFGSPTPLLQVLSRGLPLAAVCWDTFLPQLTVFCALFGHLLLTVHDMEFYSDEDGCIKSSTVPFSLSELAGMSLMLRDVCLGLIELAYPDSRPSVNDEYKQVMLSVGNEVVSPAEEEKPKNVDTWIHLFKVAVSLLHQLYTRDSRLQFCPKGHWIAKHVSFPLERLGNLRFDSRQLRFYHPFLGLRKLKKDQLEDGPPISTTEVRHVTILQELPFVVPFHDRVKIFHAFIAKDRKEHQGDRANFMLGPQIQVLIRRNYIYEDAFEKLSVEREPNVKLTMRVHLINAVGVNEPGIDGGGIFREFLSELLKTAFDPNRGFFKTTHDRLLYPNPSVHLVVEDFPKHYYFIGRMLGKAIYENMLVELPFAGFFLAKLLAKHSADLDIHHLASLDPVMYKNLVYLKTYEGDVTDLGLDFTVLNNELGENQVEELKPGGANIPVTTSNRIQYIHLMADYKLNKQIRAQCTAFKQGLANVIDLEWLRMFDPRELQVLISGAHIPVDLEDLRQHTNYSGGYSADHPVIKCFWKVVKELDETQRRQLLKFVTSCSRPPLFGFKDLIPAFCIHNAGSDPDRLPTASTCMNLLKLPEFHDEEVLRSKLLYAIESGAGFELS